MESERSDVAHVWIECIDIYVCTVDIVVCMDRCIVVCTRVVGAMKAPHSNLTLPLD